MTNDEERVRQFAQTLMTEGEFTFAAAHSILHMRRLPGELSVDLKFKSSRVRSFDGLSAAVGEFRRLGHIAKRVAEMVDR